MPGRRVVVRMAALIALLAGLLVPRPGPAEDGKDLLSPEERAWLREHDGRIRFAPLSNYPPISFRDADGQFRGITLDYARLLEERLGFRFRIVETGSWAELMRMAKAGEVDVAGSIHRTAERDAFLLFTEPYLIIPNVIITRKDAPRSLSLDKMGGMKLAVVEGYATLDYIAGHYPRIDLVAVHDDNAGLQLVSFGRADAIVTDLAVASRGIDQLGITNLRVAGDVPEFTWRLAFSVRRDWPLLQRILDKGLATVREEERNRISQNWIAVEHTPGIAPGTAWKYALWSAGAALLLFAGFTAWNSALRGQVRHRTAELHEQIAERDRGLAALAESEERFRAIFNAASDAIIIHDVESGAILDVNRRACEMFGLSREEALRAGVGGISSGVSPYVRSGAMDWMRKAAAGEPQLFGWQAKDQTGRLFWVEVNMRRAAIGPVDRLIVTARDITERKQAQDAIGDLNRELEQRVEERTAAAVEKTRELARSQRALQFLLEDVNEANRRLKDLDRLKSLFIASMSHELRTPLNSIIGFTGILLQGLAGPLNEEQRKQLGMVKTSSQHLLSLITDIIDLSKIEAGKIDLALERFDLAGTAREVLASFAPTAARAALALEIDAPAELPITSDPRRVRQVLVNLVGNAVKFTVRGSVTVSVREREGAVGVSVRDTGPGIRPEDMGKLFRSFSQVVNSGSPKHEGTGLGLYLSKKLVKLLGGEIQATSEHGVGSEFSFTLPGGKGGTKA